MGLFLNIFLLGNLERAVISNKLRQQSNGHKPWQYKKVLFVELKEVELNTTSPFIATIDDSGWSVAHVTAMTSEKSSQSYKRNLVRKKTELVLNYFKLTPQPQFLFLYL